MLDRKGRTQRKADLGRPREINEFVERVADLLPAAKVLVDAPDDAAATWWIDIHGDEGFLATLSWMQGVGFGAFTGEPMYGGRPDNLFQRADMAACCVGILHGQWQASGAVAPLWLSDLRTLTGTPQTQLASALNRNQPAISKLETRDDMKLSSLVAYVAALGGRVDLRVRFDDWEAAIELPKGGA